MELLWLQFTIILSSNECLWPSIPLLCFCSGITLTKLVGVVVLCFAKSELFVVLWSIPLIILIYLLPTSENVKWYFCFAGLLLPNVPGFGYYRILTWACVFACKSIEFYCHSSFYYLSSTCDIQCLITVFFCGLQVVLSMFGPPSIFVPIEKEPELETSTLSHLPNWPKTSSAVVDLIKWR